jgi:glucose-6-phosphate 1-dehydrogenase
MAIFGDERSPLVLAGVDYMLPIYQQANNYPNLVKEGIIGNPDDLTATQMHKQAWKIVEPILNTDQHEALSHYQKLRGSVSKLSSNSINSIITAHITGEWIHYL